MAGFEVTLEHLPTQEDFFEDRRRLIAFVGGIGTGKSHVGSDKLLERITSYPRASNYIFSNTFAQLKAGTMSTFFGRARHWGYDSLDRIREKYVMLKHRQLPIEAKIHVWTADDYDLFRSLQIDHAWIDEGHKWSRLAFLTLLGRLRGHPDTREYYGDDVGQQLWVTANPPHTMTHWLVELTTRPPEENVDPAAEIIAEQNKIPDDVADAIGEHGTDAEAGEPPIKLYTASTFDNPFLPPAYIRTLLETMDPELVDIELNGNYGDIGRGKIYRRFSRAKHILTPKRARELGIPPLEFEPETEVCWSHDFNIDPLCSVIFQWRRVRVAGFQAIVMYVLDELRIRSSLIDDAVKEIQNREAFRWMRKNGCVLYGDPAGNQGNRQTGESDWAALRKGLTAIGLRLEMRVPPSHPTHRDRFNSANGKLENGKGELGVVFVPKVRYAVEDLTKCYYKPGTSDPAPSTNEDGGTMYHLADAWSYPIAKDFPITESTTRGHVKRRQL